MELFPRDEDSKERDDGESKPDSSRRNRVPSYMADSSNASTDNKSRATPDSQKLASYRASLVGATTNINLGGIGHPIPNNNSVIAKDRTKENASVVAEMSTTNSIAEEEMPEEETTAATTNISDATSITKAKNTESVQSVEAVVNQTIMAGEGDSVNVNKGQTETENSFSAGGENTRRSNRWRHSAADCLACVRTRPPSSHELREAFFAGMEGSATEARSPPSSPSAVERPPHAEVLHHAHYMANPTHLRQTRSALLTLKQRHPDVFRSPCVYSDVCALLARDSYMLCARRFLQELFLDASFDCFASEPAAVLARHHASPSTDLQ